MVISTWEYPSDKCRGIKTTQIPGVENPEIRITLDHYLNFDHTKAITFSLREKLGKTDILDLRAKEMYRWLWQTAAFVIPTEFRSSVKEAYEFENGYVTVYLTYEPLIKE